MADMRELKGYGLAGSAYFSSGSTSVASKVFMDLSSMETMVLLWYAAGAIWSLGIAYFLQHGMNWQHIQKNIGIYLKISVIMSVAVLAWFKAIDLAGPSLVSFVSQLGIVVGVLLGTFVLKERFTWIDGIGSFLAIIGVLAITYSSERAVVIGAALALISSVGWALQNLLVKRHVLVIDKVELVFVRSVTLCVAALLLSAVTHRLVWPGLWVLPAALVMSWFGFVMVNFLIYTALNFTDVAKVSILSVIEPPTIIVISYFVFGDIPTGLQLAGGVLILIGVTVILSRPLFFDKRPLPKDFTLEASQWADESAAEMFKSDAHSD